jgi:hypothetical protein
MKNIQFFMLASSLIAASITATAIRIDDVAYG